MPCGIHTGRQDGVVLHIDFPHLAVIGNQRTAIVLTGVELHALMVILLVVMTVDTLSALVAFRATQDIVVYHALVVVLQTTLADSQFLVADIRRIDQTVAQICVDAVFRHINIERLVFRPLTVIFGIHLHADALAHSLLCQPLPVVLLRLYLITSQQQFFSVHCQTRYHVVSHFLHFKRQRCYIDGHRHVLIVGVDIGLFVRCRIVLGHLYPTSGHQHRHCNEKYLSFHTSYILLLTSDILQICHVTCQIIFKKERVAKQRIQCRTHLGQVSAIIFFH